ncbi:hypothetical protein L9F63_016675 [Diploptera punctata]|uniref:Elongation of very long chain fatty acids protein n=1 Tax=Diploptera punctata TaxID=6984 RepID=A0AAD8EHC2_DIPPU|nr:hypothetical protein L9F63_016675 [Diploptera punctata]
MAQLVMSVIDGYHDLMDNKSDPRVNDWLLMSSPFPTMAICLSYAYFVKVIGPKIMENRKPMDLRNVLIFYNLVQVIFSAWLFYESMVAGWLHYNYRCQPVDYSYSPRALRMARGCWWYYFSKFTEFMDTIFFVLRKKNDHITTLHVIHHGVMPMSVWFGVKFTPGGHSSFFGMLNTFVHIIMYLYYLLAAFGPRFQKFLWWKRYLTVLQMVQFVLVMVHAFQLLFIDCNYPKAKKQARKEALANEMKAKEQELKKLEEEKKANSEISSNGTAFYQQPDAPPSSYTTEPRHRAFVNGLK